MPKEWYSEQLRADLATLQGNGPNREELEEFLGSLPPILRRRWIEAIRRSAASLTDQSFAVDVNSLRLGEMPVVWLPEQTQELQALDSLGSLPEWLGELKGLTYLDVSGNNLDSLPEWIGELKGLTYLNVSFNSLGSLPEWIGELKGLTYLNVSHNSLVSVPEWIGELKGLTNLDLRGNRLGLLPEWIGELKGLTYLDVGGNHLGLLPEWIRELKGLTYLKVSNNSLESLPKWIGERKGLTYLNVSGNRLDSLPEWIGELKGLTYLDVSGNSLGSLPKWIGELKRLTYLNVSHNSLVSVPEWIGELKGLTYLNVSFNSLGSLPEWIGELKGLTYLNVSHNSLVSVPEWIGELKGLTNLDLRGNRLGLLPEWIGELKGLTYLDVGGNHLGLLPEWIRELKGLTYLNVSHNSLVSVPEWIGELKGLTNLDVSDNSLATLPRSVFDLPLIAWIGMIGNPLGETTTSSSDPDFIYTSLFSEDRIPLNEVKIVICGQATVGKTTLRKCLVDGKAPLGDTPETEGIDVDETDRFGTPEQPLHARIWDFGGQVILHHAHEMFLTEKTIYVVVASPRIGGEENKVGHWLRTINSFAPNAPVILVDNISDKGENTHAANYIANARNRFPQVRAALTVNAKLCKAVDKLAEAIRATAKDMQDVHEPIPAKWVRLKENVAKKAAEKPILTQDEFEEACKDAGVSEQNFQEGMRDRLSQLGIALKPVRSSEQVYVLQPSWVTTGIYKIIRAPMKCLKDGLLPTSEAMKLLPNDDYKGNLKNYILDLMVGYELALYNDASKREYMLVPALAPEVEPDTGSWAGATEIYYQYDELVEGIIPRLIIASWHPAKGTLQVSKNTFWRTGIILTWNDCRIRVTARENECLYVQVLGPDKMRPDALDRTREVIEKVNGAYANLNPDEYVYFGPGASILYNDLLLECRDRSITRRIGGVVRDIQEELIKVVKNADKLTLQPVKVSPTVPAGVGGEKPSGISHPWFHMLIPSLLGSGGLAFAIFTFAPKWIENALGACIIGVVGTFLTIAKFGYDIWKGGTKR